MTKSSFTSIIAIALLFCIAQSSFIGNTQRKLQSQKIIDYHQDCFINKPVQKAITKPIIN